jgi:hypothetical protein
MKRLNEEKYCRRKRRGEDEGSTDLQTIELIIVIARIGLVQRSVVDDTSIVNVDRVLDQMTGFVHWDSNGIGGFCNVCFTSLSLGLQLGLD